MKTKIIAINLFFILIFISVGCCTKIKQDGEAQNYMNEQILALKQQNIRLEQNIALEGKKIAKYEAQIDSLKSLKPKIIIRYAEKINKINSYHANAVAEELHRVFAKHNIKRK